MRYGAQQTPTLCTIFILNTSRSNNYRVGKLRKSTGFTTNVIENMAMPTSGDIASKHLIPLA